MAYRPTVYRTGSLIITLNILASKKLEFKHVVFFSITDACNPLVYRVLDDHRRSVAYRPSPDQSSGTMRPKPFWSHTWIITCQLEYIHSRLICLGGVPVLWSKWPLTSSLLQAIKTCCQACPPGYLMHFS